MQASVPVFAVLIISQLGASVIGCEQEFTDR